VVYGKNPDYTFLVGINMKFRRIKGLSLIELMVVLSIVGILAAVAMPSYNSHTIRASRAAAQAELLELSSILEKTYLASNAYSSNVTAAYNGTSAGGLGKTSGQTSDGKYNITFTGTPGQTYILKAVPATGIQQTGDGCLTIQENGLRQWFQKVDACTGTATAW
jgi:type IV pilus assembly protein PilE